MSLSVPIWVLPLNWRRHTTFFPSKHMHVFKRAVSQNKRLFRVALTVIEKKMFLPVKSLCLPPSKSLSKSMFPACTCELGAALTDLNEESHFRRHFRVSGG